MNNNIQIPILGDPTKSLAAGSEHTFTPGLYGGGSTNAYSVPYWPDYWGCYYGVDCVVTSPYDGMTIGQAFGTAGNITVTDSLGVDKTAECSGTFFAAVDTGGLVYKIVISGANPVLGINAGDVLHCPAGTTPANSWNAFNAGDAFGTHPLASGALDFVIQEDWISTAYETNPLLINLDEVICVKPISTTQVGIVISIPSYAAVKTSEFVIDMNEAAPTAMSLVNCINRTIREGIQKPNSVPMVNWKYTNSATQFSNAYSILLNATP